MLAQLRMEGTNNQTVFILDTLNKYENNDGVRRVFMINSNYYCIREVNLYWGTPQTPHFDDENLHYQIFDTLNEANEAVDKMLAASRIPF